MKNSFALCRLYRCKDGTSIFLVRIQQVRAGHTIRSTKPWPELRERPRESAGPPEAFGVSVRRPAGHGCGRDASAVSVVTKNFRACSTRSLSSLCLQKPCGSSTGCTVTSSVAPEFPQTPYSVYHRKLSKTKPKDPHSSCVKSFAATKRFLQLHEQNKETPVIYAAELVPWAASAARGDSGGLVPPCCPGPGSAGKVATVQSTRGKVSVLGICRDAQG